MTIIDVHTHAYTREWYEILRNEGGEYNIQRRPDGKEEIFRGNTPVAFPQPGHFDYDLRMKQMDATGIDVSIVSLTCPNVYWGNEEVSCRAAKVSNDSMAEAQRNHPSRIRWYTSLPWEYPERAIEELIATNTVVVHLALANPEDVDRRCALCCLARAARIVGVVPIEEICLCRLAAAQIAIHFPPFFA